MAQVIRPNHRRNARRDMPQLEIWVRNEGRFLTQDWSLGGAAIYRSKLGRKVGDPVAGELRLARKEGTWYPFIAVIVRDDPDQQLLGLEFRQLDSATFDFLQSMLRRPPPDR
ncbi:MAG: PilZ domain-containing protein [Rhodospirillaceae bacterium]|nr:PilZ domain-containing protein [Rhodospirillaceae bacterium]